MRKAEREAGLLRAQDAIRTGKWCKGNRDDGRGPCGVCPWCCKHQGDRAQDLELRLTAATAELQVLREFVKEVSEITYGMPCSDAYIGYAPITQGLLVSALTKVKKVP